MGPSEHSRFRAPVGPLPESCLVPQDLLLFPESPHVPWPQTLRFFWSEEGAFCLCLPLADLFLSPAAPSSSDLGLLPPLVGNG